MVTNRVARIMLVVFEESGHYPFIEGPGAFWAEVRIFLDAL